MKRLEEIIEELREQVEEATDPADPAKLKDYTAAFRDGMESLKPVILEDPTMVALAFHGQIQFVGQAPIKIIARRKLVLKTDWPTVKRSVLMRPEAHAAVRVLEKAGFEEVLVAAVVANFQLAESRKRIRESDELKEIYEEI